MRDVLRSTIVTCQNPSLHTSAFKHAQRREFCPLTIFVALRTKKCSCVLGRFVMERTSSRVGLFLGSNPALTFEKKKKKLGEGGWWQRGGFSGIVAGFFFFLASFKPKRSGSASRVNPLLFSLISQQEQIMFITRHSAEEYSRWTQITASYYIWHSRLSRVSFSGKYPGRSELPWNANLLYNSWDEKLTFASAKLNIYILERAAPEVEACGALSSDAVELFIWIHAANVHAGRREKSLVITIAPTNN